MTTIYIVVGESGDYSDHTEWFVKAFECEADAVAIVARLTEWVRENGEMLRHSYGDEKPPEDPQFKHNGDTSYYVSPLELVRAGEETAK